MFVRSSKKSWQANCAVVLRLTACLPFDVCARLLECFGALFTTLLTTTCNAKEAQKRCGCTLVSLFLPSSLSSVQVLDKILLLIKGHRPRNYPRPSCNLVGIIGHFCCGSWIQEAFDNGGALHSTLILCKGVMNPWVAQKCLVVSPVNKTFNSILGLK